jgi:peroxiredoxin
MKWRSFPDSQSTSDLRPLREIFAERKETIAKYVPPDVQAVHARVVANLKQQRVAARALGVGAKAPAFDLPDQNGKILSSVDLLSHRRLVLMFIRGRWCPFCVGQMEAMNAIADEIKSAEASLVAVSPQTQKQAFFMHDQHKLRFPLLVDAQSTVARQFSLVYRVPDEQQEIYQRTFVNLPFVNGDDSWELPIPATYVIDRDSTVLFASASEDYTERPEPLEVLGILESNR